MPAQTSPSPVRRTRAPRCSTATRPGARPVSSYGSNSAASAGPKPRCARLTGGFSSGTDGRTRIRRPSTRESALRSRRAVGQTRRMEADRAGVFTCLPPSVADSYRLRVASARSCVNSPGLQIAQLAQPLGDLLVVVCGHLDGLGPLGDESAQHLAQVVGEPGLGLGEVVQLARVGLDVVEGVGDPLVVERGDQLVPADADRLL